MDSEGFKNALRAHGLRPNEATIVGIQDHTSLSGCSVMVEQEGRSGPLGIYFASRAVAEATLEEFESARVDAPPAPDWQP